LRFESASTRVEAVGTSRAIRSVVIHPAASGRVVAVNFEPGQFVPAGHVLLELDSRDEKLAVELARVRLADAERLLDRYRRTGSSGAVLPTEIDAARTGAEAARIELGRAQVALDDRSIEAPFDGHVDFTDVDPGDRVNPDTDITTIDDRNALLVSFEIPEMLVGRLTEGSTVDFTSWNDPDSQRSGTVVELGSRIDPTSRTLVARATVDNTDDALRPGMSFRVSVNIGGRLYPVLAETAVQWGAEGAYAWLIVDGVARRTPVNIVQRQKGRILVDADLSEGDLIVVEGLQRMREGTAVEYDIPGLALQNATEHAAGSAPSEAD
jgi:RND family efflux transporter MFP subunit